ncbi:hypothetical protein B0H66DRAFT_527405 [Apodospora peruviana]|uniref:Nephrocystin 3-like N-terminal domain-containing protein n=1 Tax=Apodospora peruviana TaxID=516989 RepID=A0AAE0IRT2_9PEZI|nr:hypothetical protein B0H66DRAFT_527405 [Apodospora peruviana]
MAEALAIIGGIAASAQLAVGISQAAGRLRCIGKKKMAEASMGIRGQLELLEDILRRLDARQKTKPVPAAEQRKLAATIGNLQLELKVLNKLVTEIEQAAQGSGRLVRRTVLAVRNYETRLKTLLARIETFKTLLELYVVGDSATGISETLDAVRANETHQVRELLQPCSSSFIPKRLGGTLEWIWSHPKMVSWMGDPIDLDRVLCIHGVKGCGKSVLAATIADGLAESGHLAVLFSFWAANERQQKLESMLHTFLWHLFIELADTKPEMAQRLASKLRNGHPMSNGCLLTDMIGTALGAINRPVYLIIDGVDECIEEWNSAAEGGLKMVKTLLDSHSQLQILLLGRESGLRQSLNTFPESFQITKDLVRQDLSALISAELDLSPNIQSEEIKELVRSKLEEKATTMFLWVKLIFKELRSSFSRYEIRVCLDNVPMELDVEYHRLFLRLMNRLNGRPDAPSIHMMRAKDLFSLIIGATRPLTMNELRHAYALHRYPGSGFEDYLVSDEGIIDACGDFITMSDGHVHLGHSSFEEFLTRPKEFWETRDKDVVYFRVDVAEAQRSLGLLCIARLQTVDWLAMNVTKNFESLREPAGIERHPLLVYSLDGWAAHLLRSRSCTPEALTRVKGFMESPSLFGWLEYSVSGVLRDPKHLATFSTLISMLLWCDNGAPITGSILEQTLVNIQPICEAELEKRRMKKDEVTDASDASTSSSLFEALMAAVMGSLDDLSVGNCTTDQTTTLSDDDGTPLQEPLINCQPLQPQRPARYLQLNAPLMARLSEFLFEDMRAHKVPTTLLGFKAANLSGLVKTFGNLLQLALSPAMVIPVPALVAMGLMNMERGNYQAALGRFKVAHGRVRGQRNSYEAMILVHLGWCYFNLGDYESAQTPLLEAAEVALAAQTIYAGAIALSGVEGAIKTCLELKQWDEAERIRLAYVDRCMNQLGRSRLGPFRLPLETKNELFYLSCMMKTLASLHMGMDRLEQSVACLRESITILRSHYIPGKNSARYLCHSEIKLADVLLRLGRIGEAQTAFSAAEQILTSKGTKLIPGEKVERSIHLALLKHLQNGNPAAAEPEFCKTLQLAQTLQVDSDPSLPMKYTAMAYFWLAECRKELGKTTEAAEAFAKAGSICRRLGGFWEAWHPLLQGRSHRLLGNRQLTEIEDMVHKAHNHADQYGYSSSNVLSSFWSELCLELAEIYAEANHFEKAERALRLALQKLDDEKDNYRGYYVFSPVLRTLTLRRKMEERLASLTVRRDVEEETESSGGHL